MGVVHGRNPILHYSLKLGAMGLQGLGSGLNFVSHRFVSGYFLCLIQHPLNFLRLVGRSVGHHHLGHVAYLIQSLLNGVALTLSEGR
jgi:hypothetical protein